jgi:hypothetical protein
LADHVHDLLDDIVAQGNTSPLEILWFWFLDDDKDTSLKPHTLLFGALRRAIEWHKASMTIIHAFEIDNCSLKDWSRTLQCSTISINDISKWTNIYSSKLNHTLVWHGPVYFVSHKPNQETTYIPSCELHCNTTQPFSNKIVSSGCTTWMEVVAFVHETKVQLGLLSLNAQYSLTCLKSQHDNGSYLDQLQKLMVADNVCMLLRLCHSKQSKHSVSPRFHEQWTKHVTEAEDSNISLSLGNSDCPVDHVCIQGRLMLAMVDAISDEPRLRVYLLHHVEGLQTGLSLLPVVDSWKQLEFSVLEDMAGVLSELPCHGSQNESELNDKKWLQSLSETLQYALNPHSLPERIALQNEEQILRSHKSVTDLDPLLDTQMADNPENLNLNVEELLQYFSEDGQALQLSLSPLKTQSSSLASRPQRKYSTAAARLSAHGIESVF